MNDYKIGYQEGYHVGRNDLAKIEWRWLAAYIFFFTFAAHFVWALIAMAIGA